MKGINVSLKTATEAAERIMKYKSMIKELRSKMEDDMQLLCQHAQRTGNRRYGSVQVFERTTTKLTIEQEVELIKALSANQKRLYVKQSLNTKALLQAKDDPEIKDLLQHYGAEVEQSTSFQTKHY